MKSNIKLVGHLLGKPIYVHDCGLRSTDDQKQRFLSKHSFLSVARRICELSKSIKNDQEGITSFSGIPIDDAVLIESITLAAKWCDKSNMAFPFPDISLELLLRFSHGEIEAGIRTDGGIYGILTRVAYQQFRVQESALHLLGRSWYIFSELWYRHPRKIDPRAQLETLVGLPYNQIVLYAMALAGNTEGFSFPYDSSTISQLQAVIGAEVTTASYQKFLDWISCTMGEILTDSIPPALIAKPVLNSGISPNSDGKIAYFAPSSNGVIAKATTGIYFTLMDANNRGKDDNPFKEDYGFVFEEYVGELLRFYVKDGWEVCPEISYIENKNTKKSIDYFVSKNEKLILFEIKQSSIFAKSKTTGDEGVLGKDMGKTLAKAADQINNTLRLIPNHKSFEKYKKCTLIEKVIVFSDPLYNANGPMKDLLRKSTTQNISDIHIINVSDLETILDAQHENQSLFDLLEFKKKAKPMYDFKEYTLEMFPEKVLENKFIREKYERLFSEKLIERLSVNVNDQTVSENIDALIDAPN